MRIVGKLCGMSAVVFIVAACVTPPVEDVSNEKPLHWGKSSCSVPYPLVRFCSYSPGGKFRVVIDGFDVNLATTDDGRVLLITDAHRLRNEYLLDSWYESTSSTAVNKSYRLVRSVLDQNGVGVTRVRAYITNQNIQGYVLELSTDGFSVLERYAPKR